MRYASSADRMVLRGLTLCVIALVLTGCMASAATMLVSQTVKTTTKAAGTMARAVSHTITRPFRKEQGTTAPAK